MNVILPGSPSPNFVICYSQYIDETEEQAMEALRKNEHILRKLTEELLTRTKISGFVSLLALNSMILS